MTDDTPHDTTEVSSDEHTNEVERHWADFECPVCGDYAHAGLSGNIESDVERTIDGDGIARVCVLGPDDDHDHSLATMYFHPERYVQPDSDRDD